MIQRRYNISELLRKRKSLLILGPRGVGKSFLINSILTQPEFAQILKINLLSSDDYANYLHAPSLLTRQIRTRVGGLSQPLYVFIDEIQLVPDLLNEVHLVLEELPDRVVFILTGSSARKLKRSNANLLAGRALLLPFFPVSLMEYDFDLHFDTIMKFGALPKVLEETDSDLNELYLKTYSLTYLKEEIQQEALVRNLPAFSRFLELAAQHNGQPINCSRTAKTLGISANTVAGYYAILEDTLLTTVVPTWSHSVRTQLQKAARHFLFDNGIVRALCGELRSELTERSFRFGAMFENLVVNEIVKAISITGSDLKLYSFRTTANQEIDLILQSGPFSPPIGVEIKSATAPTAADVRSLKLLRNENADARLIVLCRCKHPYVEDEIEFEPYREGIMKIVGA